MNQKLRYTGLFLIMIAMILYRYKKHIISGAFGLIGFVLIFISFFLKKD
jgi:membrane-bound ClpP family serine protease